MEYELEGGVVENDLGSWVVDVANEWREHYQANYEDKHREYYRLWRGIWAEEDKVRESERSRLIAPASQQAVESSVAEIEEATFSSGKVFELEDDPQDQNKADIELLQKQLRADIKRAKVRKDIGECLINAAVYGTGVAEINIEETTEYVPTTQPTADPSLQEYGVEKVKRPLMTVNPLQPQNFLIDPTATCVDSASGCIVEQFVSAHSVYVLQDKGYYDSTVHIETSPPDQNIEANPELDNEPLDRVKLTKYYGEVPRELLEAYGIKDIEGDDEFVEAIVVVCGDGEILKAMENPYMCKDRPIVAFPWDVVPGVFWGRGVVEKAYMSQKALDAELRARIDALALTTHPMMGVDADRIPRGVKYEVAPGKMFATQGPPAEILTPFNFGQVDQITFQQSASLQNMVQQATGAVDSAGMAQGAAADGTLGGMAMSLGSIIKRQKRTLVNFQESFLVPLIEKIAKRYMQFDPSKYPVRDFTFSAVSSLGVVAREYEIGQLSQAIQTLPAGTPAHSAVMRGILEHLSISNREEILQILEQSSKPDPQAQQAAQQQQQLEMAVLQGQLALLDAQKEESLARAKKYNVEAELDPIEAHLKYADTNNDGQMDRDFEQRLALAQEFRADRDMDLRERQMALQEDQAKQQQKESAAQQAEAELIRQLTAAQV